MVLTDLKKSIPLFIILLVFVALKVPQLHYAYYWDESWPYAVAIKGMYQHGVSLMPNAIDAELSRGHPLFFHAVAATWMHIFGSSHISMHSFALLISALFLIAIYETALRIFDQRTALLALLLIVVQEMFFIQSSLVLLEMLVAFLCFLSLVFYIKERYLLTALSLTMLFYTKESGLVMGAVLGIDTVVSMLNKNTPPLKLRLYKMLSVAVPCAFIGIFFLVQKHVRGWYVFPLYSGLIQHRWDIFWYTFRMSCITTLFYEQLRFYYFLLLLPIAVIAAVRQKNTALMTILLPAFCIYYFVDDTRAGRILPSIPFFILFVAASVFFIYTYSAKEYCPDSKQRKLVRLSGWFVLCFLCFSAMNFFTPRYLLAAMIPLFFIISVCCVNVIKQSYTWLYYAVILAVLTIGGFAYMHNDAWGDCEHGIFDGLYVQQGVVDYFEKNVPNDLHIAALFMEGQHLSDPATGFLHRDKPYTDVKWDINDETRYAIFDNIEADERYTRIKNDTGFYLAKRIEKGKVWAEIYKRK